MYKHVIITDKNSNFIPEHPERLIISATDFISNNADVDLRKEKRLKVINLCSNYTYLSKGYYCSLLAEARDMRCVPSVGNIVTLNWKRHYQSSLHELNGMLEKYYNEPPDEPLARTYMVYFGRIENDKLESVARRIFDLFRFPLMALEIKYDNNGKWAVENINPVPPGELPPEKQQVFARALDKFTGAAWRTHTDKKEKYWIGILQDPKEKFPPSNKAALNKFVKVGKEMNISIELLTKNDYASLLEYDALFIRETTSINHHTFRFAHKAESEGIACIDDTQSIIRCCNKVFLYELLRANHLPLPQTMILDRKTEKAISAEIDYPTVLKIPDGSFSRGVVKAVNPEDFHKKAQELFKESDILLVQEFVPSTFDWRIGVLGGEPIFACQYFMAKDHWQVYNHGAKKPGGKEGHHKTIDVRKVPKDVMNVSLKACRLIGNGLYGVDLKQTENGIYIMEVNDNPSLDGGVEDQFLGDELYRKVLAHLVKMIES